MLEVMVKLGQAQVSALSSVLRLHAVLNIINHYQTRGTFEFDLTKAQAGDLCGLC